MKHFAFRPYISLFLLFVPPTLFIGLLLFVPLGNKLAHIHFPYFPWQFFLIGIAGIIATVGGVLDWRYHRDPLKLKLPKKERDAEAAALGLGGVPMFFLMWFAMNSSKPAIYLIPILIVLIYTVVAISYDEFVFHIKRCTRIENIYHRMLVFGNGAAWLAWFHYIYC